MNSAQALGVELQAIFCNEKAVWSMFLGGLGSVKTKKMIEE